MNAYLIKCRENWYNGCVVNIYTDDLALFTQNYISEKKHAMRLSFAPLEGVKLYDGSYHAQHEVFNNEYLMNIIFTQVRCIEDKANMAMVWKKWSQLFLFHPSAPRIDLVYRVSLEIHDIDGVRIFSRGSRIVYQRYKCFLTEDVNTKFMLHYIQHRNAFENSHLNDLDDIASR
ncbi:hypothetical protein RND81_09G024300 [Saponaria officinalis]|uniref:Uncharacterized protein n=1 Tax=Saponaria officinalis TaxID=3572 RepID=A0AAW1IHP8_SAPOF